MKKLSMFLSTLIITFFAFSLVVSANEQSINTNDQNLNDLLYEDLNPGEKVVGFYRETTPIDEVKLPLDSRLDNEITPLERTRKWYPMTKVYMGHYYGSWKYAGASTISGGVLSASHTSTVSNTYSGSLKATKRSIDAFIGFDITNSYSKTVSYSTLPLPKISGKGHRLEYRHVYKNYNVKQELKYDRRASQVYGTSHVHPKKWVERQYRVVEFYR